MFDVYFGLNLTSGVLSQAQVSALMEATTSVETLVAHFEHLVTTSTTDDTQVRLHLQELRRRIGTEVSPGNAKNVIYALLTVGDGFIKTESEQFFEDTFAGDLGEIIDTALKLLPNNERLLFLQKALNETETISLPAHLLAFWEYDLRERAICVLGSVNL